eukprot:1263623-Alexandrium_andersonii.AAC.1
MEKARAARHLGLIEFHHELSRTSPLLMRRWLMFWLRERQSARGGPPISRNGRRAHSSRMARSRSPGLL